MNIHNLSLVKQNDPILHQPCQKWNFIQPAFDLPTFAENLVKVMHASNGIGLAANQVGIPYKIFAMNCDPVFVVVNPKIVDISDEMITLDEGCLSYPGLIIKVKRPRQIKVRFNYPSGDAGSHVFEGMTARCFLHEFDHIEYGHTFLDNLNPIHKEKALRQLKKLNRSNK